MALVAGEFACGGKKEGPCGSDYNCPDGQYCVRGICTTDVPPTPEPSPEPTIPDASPKPEAKPEPDLPVGPKPCASSDDCDSVKPHCFRSKCVRGYASFDFTGNSNFIVDTNAAARQCTSDTQCANWQSCNTSARQCSIKVDTSSKVTGKFLDEGIALTDYSYALLTDIDGKQYLRIQMFTNFSDRLNKLIIIDILLSEVKSGNLTIDGQNIRAGYYDDLIEFTPSRLIPVAVATSGVVQLAQVGTAVGGRVSGRAELIFD